MDDAALRRRLLEDGWEAEARSDRWVAGAGGAALLLAWISDLMLLGPTPQAFVLLGVRLLGVTMLVPSLVASLAKRPPERIDRARLFLVASALPVLALIAINPTSLAADGWGMVATWTLLAIWANVPLVSKTAMLGSSYLLFLVQLWLVMKQRGPAYGHTSEVVTVVVCGAMAVLALPWLPHRTERHRLRELASRLRLEQEIRLREQREREAREAEARADRAAVLARQAAHKAQEEARLRTELFANMSHDLRTPMAGILGIVELMQDTPLTEEQAGFIATIRASNQTLLSLLDDVIDFARIEEGKLPIAPVTVPLAETLLRPAELMRVTAERKQLRLHVDLSSGLPRHVKLDPLRVQQVLLNLLGNAVKFTQHGSVTLRASMRGLEGSRTLRVEVEDTGIGFTEAQQERLFRRFSQADDKTVHKFGGSGLGLSICKSLVELMGGRIGAERRAEQGALFWFELPIEASEAPVAAEHGPSLPQLRVLLAEDNPVNQLVVSTMLKKLGQSVTLASDGEQALRLLLEESFDLAIVDMQMPLMNGDELVRHVRRSAEPASKVRIVALTAAAEPEKRAEFLAAGVDAVYTKPIDMSGLRHLVQVEGATGASDSMPAK